MTHMLTQVETHGDTDTTLAEKKKKKKTLVHRIHQVAL